ncbi:MAG TPA: polysaccharide deacetylase family protein [Candidatus Baltobacteraceae bacterium]
MKRRDALATIASTLIAASPHAVRAEASGVPVFMYHHVNNTIPSSPLALGLTLPTGSFEAQLRYLASHKIATLTAGELADALSRDEHPTRTVVLTFDDGYEDSSTVIAPLLARYGARATFFVNAGTIEHRNHLSWREMRALRAAGCEIGAHGMHHLDLSTLDRDGQLHEAGDCVARIERFLGVRPVSYAYASGAYNKTTLDVMREIGIHSAWTEHVARAKDVRNPYEMPRLRITRDMTVDGFAALVSG